MTHKHLTKTIEPQAERWVVRRPKSKCSDETHLRPFTLSLAKGLLRRSLAFDRLVWSRF